MSPTKMQNSQESFSICAQLLVRGRLLSKSNKRSLEDFVYRSGKRTAVSNFCFILLTLPHPPTPNALNPPRPRKHHHGLTHTRVYFCAELEPFLIKMVELNKEQIYRSTHRDRQTSRQTGRQCESHTHWVMRNE
jgi:hypothetical protein